MLAPDEKVTLDLCEQIEFDQWQWVDYWHPQNQVIEFKREVYQQALQELSIHKR